MPCSVWNTQDTNLNIQKFSNFSTWSASESIYTALTAVLGDDFFVETMIDLGCGTGRMGKSLRKHGNILLGVDLSSKMLEIAFEKALYDELHLKDILSWGRGGDLVCASDTFNYQGELESVFAKFDEYLSSGSILSFSIELSDEDYKLQKTGRFAHSQAYVMGLAKGWKLLSFKEFMTKKEQGSQADGMVFVFQKIELEE